MEPSIDIFVSSFKRSEISAADEDTILSVFSFIFPDSRHLEAALDILDKNKAAVSSYRGISSDRLIWKVLGSKGSYYMCLKQFCPCRSFTDLNRSSPKLVFCKHLIATRLATCMGLIDEKVVSDQEFVDLITLEYSRSEELGGGQ